MEDGDQEDKEDSDMGQLNATLRALEITEMQSDKTGEVMDLGPFATLIVLYFVLTEATSGNIWLEHAAVNKAEAFVKLGSEVTLDTAGSTVHTHSSFLRFVRWATDTITGGPPKAAIVIVAKDP
jgi:hypothetical protein